jgi:CO/xanthine dehydrogenase Mo-binding subunit
MNVIGQSVARIDAFNKVRGEALYPGDFNLPGQSFMKVLFAGRPHAIVRSIDTSAAEAIPGVLAVLTAKDVPINEYGLGVPDQPVLCGPGSSNPYGDRVRFVGDQVALVVAESEDIAARACSEIRVVYEDLPAITNAREAMGVDAVVLHPDQGSNVFCRYRIRKGDIATAFAAADVIVTGEYETPAQEHAYLQPEAGICFIDDEDRITVVVAGQWTHEDQEQIAHSLGLPLDKIRVIYPAIGGAFGGREDMSVQIILALAVMKLQQQGISRPVKIIWSREESIVGHHKRHPYSIRTRWGATKQGKIIAAEVEIVADGGAYVYTSPKVLGNATIMCTGPYEIPNVNVDSCAVYTNNIPNGAFRGFGGPQGAFAAELQMNKLAEALGMDPVEIRMRNILREGSLLSVGTPLPQGVTIDRVVEQCAIEAGWNNTAQGWQLNPVKTGTINTRRRGIGFACAFKNVGFSFGAPEQCTATVELYGEENIERAILFHSGADVGQGAHTVFAQMAAEALGIPISCIGLVVSDTAMTPPSGSASASRMTFMAGNSIKGACERALERWNAEERPVKVTYQYRPPATTALDAETGKSAPNFAYGYVAEAIDLEVDLETGKIHVLNVVCADDVGHALNPVQVQGQVEGAVIQGLGYAVLEDFRQPGGIPQTRSLSTYLIPTVLDVPDRVQSVILEYPDPRGPWGARGMGEMPILPFTPALISALHMATGIWFDDFPVTPERILRGLGKISD